MAMQAGPVREHGGHYKRRYVHIRTAQNLNLDMDLYLAGELSERNMTLKAREFAAVQANAVNTSLTFMQKKMLVDTCKNHQLGDFYISKSISSWSLYLSFSLFQS